VYADRYDAGRGAGYDRHRMAALTTAATAATDMPSGRSVALWVLLGFLGSWLFIRTSARLMRNPNVTWWPGSVKTSGGLHIHHLVWGIGLMVVCGFLGFALEPSTPRSQIIGSLFGIGVGFTLDEFALWLRLQDVYWSEQGRASIDVSSSRRFSARWPSSTAGRCSRAPGGRSSSSWPSTWRSWSSAWPRGRPRWRSSAS